MAASLLLVVGPAGIAASSQESAPANEAETPATGSAETQPADTQSDPEPEPDPFALEPVSFVAQRAARNLGEKAADEIRGRVRATAEARIDVAEGGSEVATSRVETVEAALIASVLVAQEAGVNIDRIQFAQRELVEVHRGAAATFQQRMARLYVLGPTRVVDALLDGYDIAAARSRAILLDAVLDADQENLVAAYLGATTDVTDVGDLAADLRDEVETRAGLSSDRVYAIELADAAALALDDVQGVRVDLAFPVAGTYSFVDTFLAGRMVGTRDVHRHLGTDIFAENGTPLVAVERGVVVRVGEVRLGGLRLWLIGESGAHYYYAHLSGFGDIDEGQFVETGTVLGFVGTSGNARGTPPHVHFQVHPDGGNAVNGFPLLRQLADRDIELVESGDQPYGLCPRPDPEMAAMCP